LGEPFELLQPIAQPRGALALHGIGADDEKAAFLGPDHDQPGAELGLAFAIDDVEPLAGIADDVLHLLDEDREQPLRDIDVRLVHRELLLQRLGESGEDVFGDIAGIERMTPSSSSRERKS